MMRTGFKARRLFLGLGPILLLGLGSPAHAQEPSLGVRSGVSGSYAIFEDELAGERSVRAGPLLGGLITFPLGGWVSLQVEARYSTKGWRDAGGTGGRSLGYLEVPLLLRLQRSGRLLPHLVLGPAVGYEVTCKFPVASGTEALDCDDPLASLDRPSLDVGLLAGVGVGRSIGPGTLWFDTQMTLGLRDMDREPLPRGSQRNIAVSLSLAYTVSLASNGG